MNATQAPNTTNICTTARMYHFDMTRGFFVSTIASCVVNTASSISALVGNMLVIIAISLNHELHHNANYLLVMLAATDLLTGCLSQPIFVAFQVEMLLNKASCGTATILTAVRSLTTMASVFTAFAVCLERTLAIMVPFYYEARITPRRLIVTPVSAWIVFSLFDASRFVGFPIGPLAGVRSVVLLVCLVSTVVCYGLLIRVANKHRKQIASQEVAVQSAEHREKNIRENKSLKMAIYVNGAYLLCYVPLVVGLVVKIFSDLKEGEMFVMNSWMGTMVFLNASLNPVIYCWRSKKIRRAILRLCGRGQNAFGPQTENK